MIQTIEKKTSKTSYPGIAGIQQMGIGVPNANEAFKWYNKFFGIDVPIINDTSEALYTTIISGEKHLRHAILAVNLKGGGGFEIWQYTTRKPQAPDFDIELGDLGIYSTKIKSNNVQSSYSFLKSAGVNIITPINKSPEGKPTFYLRDPWNNIFQIVEAGNWFGTGKQLTGGVYGCTIGVSNIEKSKLFYGEILGYDTVVYEKQGIFSDLENLSQKPKAVKRVLLKHSKSRVGAFSNLLGPSEIELIEIQDGTTGRKIFKNRIWGDLGFIHLCFDITNQQAMKQLCADKGFPFTVDGGENFTMGEAAGHFTYTEDPDGTLIEFVETKKLPIIKKLGWYLDLRKRDALKPLPDWLLKCLALNRKKAE